MNQANEVHLPDYEPPMEAEAAIALEMALMVEEGLVEIVTLDNGELAFSLTEAGIQFSQEDDHE